MIAFHGWRPKRQLSILWTVYLFFCCCCSSSTSSFSYFHTLINTIDVKKLMKANRQRQRQWRKIESSWASITLAALHVCSLFAVTVKERKKSDESSQPLFRRLCFPSWVPVIYTSFFLIACLLSPIAVAAFLLLLCSFAIRSTLSSRLPCFFLLFNWEAHRAHNARFVDFTSLVELCINFSRQNKR